MIRECAYCGRLFNPSPKTKIYCSVRCRYEANYEVRKREAKKPPAEKQRKKYKGMALNDLANEATAHGMSYGKYVAFLEGRIRVDQNRINAGVSTE